MDIYNSGACFIVPSLLSRKYFFTVVLGVTSLLATCGLGALTIEQISNIAQNLVRPNIFFCAHIVCDDVMSYDRRRMRN